MLDTTDLTALLQRNVAADAAHDAMTAVMNAYRGDPSPEPVFDLYLQAGRLLNDSVTYLADAPAGTVVRTSMGTLTMTEGRVLTGDGLPVRRGQWCTAPHVTFADEVPYLDPESGAHGYACDYCRGVAQTG